MKKFASPSFIFWLAVTIIPIVGIIFSLTDPQSFAQAQDVWRGRIVAFGIFAPLAFILIQALQVIITPISHYSIGVVGGFLYGPYLGALFNWIGRMIGHTAAFFIAHFFGRKMAEKFVKQETLQKYDKYISNKSLILFILYFLPLFPDDELSYLAGLSKMKFRMFFLVNFFGHIGGSLGLAYLGSGINTKDPPFWILTAVTLIGLPLLYWLLKKSKAVVNQTDNKQTACIIIHGCPSDAEKAARPETRTYDKHWIPWIKKELEARGVRTEVPLMPTPWEPDYEKFKKEFEKYEVGENTILIGHSCGGAFLVRWLGETKRKILKLIFVAPWKIPKKGDEFRDRFYNYPIDESIKSRAQEIVMFTADDEDEEGKESLKIFQKALGGEAIELSGHGHYVMEDMGTSEFPELLDVVLR